MKSRSFILRFVSIILALALLSGCGGPAVVQTPTFPPPPPQTVPPPTPAQPAPPTGQAGLFKLVKSVDVTPVDNLAGGLFVRIGYVPGKDRIVVSFKAKLGQAVDGCTDAFGQPSVYAIAYREYTTDMQETDSYGIITCQAGPDVGGMFLEDDYYYAAMGHDNVNNVDGWYLAKYDAVTWASTISPFFYSLATEELTDDPMVAMVNGQIDISSHYKRADEMGPGHATHHQFFTPDLQFVGNQVLTDTSHINLTSLLVVNGVINLVTSTDLWGDMIVLQYDMNWNYLGAKTLKQHASAPEGAAFDGTRFYVSYIDNSLSEPGKPGGNDNIRLAAFDLNWNLLDDIAVTSFVPDDHKAPARPSLTLHDNRLYVCYDQGENPQPDQPPEKTDIQVHVKVYELSTVPPAQPGAPPTLPPAATQSAPPTAQASLFSFVQTITVTPDEAFSTAGLGLIKYVPATDRLLVFLAAEVAETPPGCPGRRIHAYKEYTLDMQPTGNYDVFSCWGGDAIVLMVDNSLYFAADGQDDAGTAGWWLYKYDAVTWQQVGEEFHVPAKEFPAEHTDGPSLTYVNGMIDLFDVYAESGQVGSMLIPRHHFFTPDLEPLEVRTLAEGPAMYGASLLYVDGVYYYLTSTGPDGDLVVRRYDQNWKFLGEKTARDNATLTSAAFDGQRFYVAFMDNSRRVPSDSLAAFSIHLAAFDRDWNLIEDIPVTTWSFEDGMQTDSPGVLLHQGRLYVTYNAHKVNPETYQDCPDPTKPCRIEHQVYVSVYDLTQP